MVKFFDGELNTTPSEEIEPEAEVEEKDFRYALESLINHYSMENGSDTPDFILAEYLCNCLRNFDDIVKMRESWYGRQSEPLFIGDSDDVDKLEK